MYNKSELGKNYGPLMKDEKIPKWGFTFFCFSCSSLFSQYLLWHMDHPSHHWFPTCTFTLPLFSCFNPLHHSSTQSTTPASEASPRACPSSLNIIVLIPSLVCPFTQSFTSPSILHPFYSFTRFLSSSLSCLLFCLWHGNNLETSPEYTIK